MSLTHFRPYVLFSDHLKTSENQWLFDVFRYYKMTPLARNELIESAWQKVWKRRFNENYLFHLLSLKDIAEYMQCTDDNCVQFAAGNILNYKTIIPY